MNPLKGKHILIIVENLPVPFDRRVWQEAKALKDGGADVSIICPKTNDYNKSFENINGIFIYRHPLKEASGSLGYFREYVTAFFWQLWFSCKIYFRKRFHVIHGCNPPDLIFIVALIFKVFGVKYVFDHHDINPELYIAKYNKKGLFFKCLLFAERLTFATANYSIATNESYKEIAIQRGKMNPDKVEVVRSGPELGRLKIMPPYNCYKKGRKYLVGYLGVIGVQEGLDLLLESIRYIVNKRQDVQFAIVGKGPELEIIKKLSTALNLNEYVDFYGRVADEKMLAILNTSDICVNPDKPTPMNNLSTMNKIMEYMALKKPIVQFDLKEGRYSAQEASLYASDVNDFAQKIMLLLNNSELRTQMGELGYRRVINELSWSYESKRLLEFYRKIFGDLSQSSNLIQRQKATNSSFNKVRGGIIGLGKMGISHAAIIGANSTISFTSACDTSSFVLEAFKTYTDINTYTDFKKMLDSEALDFIIVATPTKLHYEMIRYAVEKGIHVFCEKPFLLNTEEGEALVKAVSTKHLINQVGYHNNFIGTFKELKRLVKANVLGAITGFRGEAYGPVVVKKKGNTWRSKAEEGGGCLYDYASHVINLIQEIIAPPVNVKGAVLKSIYSNGVEDEVYSVLQLENNVTGLLSVNWSDETYRKMSTTLTVEGVKGKIVCDATEIKVYLKEDASAYGYEKGWTIRPLTDFTEGVNYYLRGEEYSAQIDYFINNIIRKTQGTINTFQQALYTDKIIEMIIGQAKPN